MNVFYVIVAIGVLWCILDVLQQFLRRVDAPTCIPPREDDDEPLPTIFDG